jgi:peptidylprolyl isomerase
MKKTIIRIVLVVVLAIAGFMGYMYLTQPELAPVPPVPSASNEVAPVATSTPAETVETGETETTTTEPDATSEPTTEIAAVEPDPAPAVVSPPEEILVIEVAGSNAGTIEILLNSEKAPGHVARIKALAASGAYDDVVFHRVIEGFMAQTGDVEFGKRSGSIGRAGMGGSNMDNLKAEFSQQMFAKGVVGMARSNSPDSANSQFFIMFGPAPYLNGKYTIVGRVVAGQDVVDAIKKGDADDNGSVDDPDYMKTVRLKTDG